MLVNINEGAGNGGDNNNAHNSHNNNSGGNNNNNRAAFVRGDKSSASVRLRTKKSDGGSNPGNGKKRNRHSGDFSFFSSKSEQNNSSVSPTRGTDVKKGGDWAYITFPNGVPTVQDIKTNVGPVSQKEIVAPVPVVPVRGPPNPATAAILVPGSRASVHLPTSMMSRRMGSTDFVSLDNPSADFRSRQVAPGPGVVMRQRPPQQQQFYHQQQQQQQLYRNSCFVEAPLSSSAPKHVTQVTVTSSMTPPVTSSPSVKRPLSTANVIFRRKVPIPGNNGVHSSGVAKRCSGEFDFVRHNHRSSLVLLDSPEPNESDIVRVRVRDGSHPSPDLVMNRPPDTDPVNRVPGLGRRAVTQINIRHNKKNSYNAAICKSQENLVKVSAKWLKIVCIIIWSRII